MLCSLDETKWNPGLGASMIQWIVWARLRLIGNYFIHKKADQQRNT